MEFLILAAFRAANYALIAVGFSLVFGSLRVLNLMHGTYVMLGAYAAHIYIVALAGRGGGGSGAVAAGGVALAALTTAVIGWSFFKALQITGRTAPKHVLAISVAGNLFVAQLVQFLYGTEGLNVDPVLAGRAVILGVAVPRNDLLVPPVAVVAIAGLWYWLQCTRSGRALRAVADDPQGAALVGIPPGRMLAGAVGVAAFLAGLAGALTAPSHALSPDMWIHPLLVSFAVVVFGGSGSTWGALGSAALLALAETATSWFWSEAASQYVSLLIIVVGLLVFPTGLAGAKRHDVR
jgi:branched-chain amino acid transport system permease protein